MAKKVFQNSKILNFLEVKSEIYQFSPPVVFESQNFKLGFFSKIFWEIKGETLGRILLHHHIHRPKLHIQITFNSGSRAPVGRYSAPWSCKVENLKTYNLKFSMSDPTQTDIIRTAI